jgi:ATP-binding cassette subfamily B protein
MTLDVTGTSGHDEVSVSRMETMVRLLRYLTIKKAKLAGVVVLFFIGAISFLSISILFGRAIENLTTIMDKDALLTTALSMLIAAIVSFITLFIAYRWLADITQTALYQLRKELFDHIQTLSLNFFDRQPIGELMSRITNDMDTISALYQAPIGTLILGAFMLVISVVSMVVLSWELAIIALLVIPLILGLVWFLSKFAGPAFASLQNNLADLNGIMEETLDGERTVIAYRQQNQAADTLEDASVKVRNIGAKAQILSLVINPLTVMSTYLDLAIVGLIGSVFVLRDIIGVGTLSSFLSLTLLFIFPLISIFANYNYIISAATGAGRVFKIMDEKPQIIDSPNTLSMKPVEGHVVFEEVDFSYIPGRKVLKKNSFEAKPGQMIGLCGPTGAGKSTIINILTRYYDIDSGSIFIDGQSVYEVTQESLRKQVGVVLQEAFLFSDTVMNNLRYAREEATDEECIEAAKRANCHEFISRLPHAYETVLSERGSNLSQGQRQLLTIARAMVANPRMLILDEATSNVDTRTEKAIQEALENLQKGKTSFVIAHRLSTIKDADQILVINKGEIVERGTHEELMDRRGFYYDLYMTQYKGRVAEIIPFDDTGEVTV